MASALTPKWLRSRCCFRRPDCTVRLVCFPWAGGGATPYYLSSWAQKFPKQIEVCSVCLPGRESRFTEPFYTSWPDLVRDFLAEAHDFLSEKPFAFWGHSLGAGLCFESARLLKVKYGIEPVHLFISGTSAPQHPKRVVPVASLSDGDLIQKMKRMGGVPAELQENREMMSIAARIFRADLTLIQNYKFVAEDNAVLSCPVTCFDGSDDLHDQDGWSEVVSGEYNRHILPGGHFYLMEGANEKKVHDTILTCLGIAPS